MFGKEHSFPTSAYAYRLRCIQTRQHETRLVQKPKIYLRSHLTPSFEPIQRSRRNRLPSSVNAAPFFRARDLINKQTRFRSDAGFTFSAIRFNANVSDGNVENRANKTNKETEKETKHTKEQSRQTANGNVYGAPERHFDV